MFQEIDWQAKELCIDDGGLFENTYTAGLSNATSTGAILTNLLVDNFPRVLTPPFPPMSDWKLIGYSCDGKDNYREPSIRITPEGPVPAPLLHYLKLSEHYLDGCPHEAYSLKFRLRSGRMDLKILKAKYPSVVLPEGCRENRGTGVHVTKARLASYREIYFASTLTQREMEQAFDCPVPYIRSGPKYYCGLYDQKEKRIIRLRQILYPTPLSKAPHESHSNQANSHGAYPRLDTEEARQG